jgi:hypothetical protein
MKIDDSQKTEMPEPALGDNQTHFERFERN